MTEPIPDRIFGDLLVQVVDRDRLPSSAHLADALGVAPDCYYDDERRGPPTIVYGSGLPKQAPFSAHLAALLTRVAPARARLTDLVRAGTVVTQLRLSGEVADVSVDLVLEPAQLAFTADVGLRFSLHADYHEGMEYYREQSRWEREQRRQSADSAN